MYIIIFTQFFQLIKNSKNLTFFVSSGCKLKPLFPQFIAVGELPKHSPRVMQRVKHTRNYLEKECNDAAVCQE